MRISDDIMQVIKQLGDEALFQEHERTHAEEVVARQAAQIEELEAALVDLQQELVRADEKAAKYKRKYRKLKPKSIADEASEKARALGAELNYKMYWENYENT